MLGTFVFLFYSVPDDACFDEGWKRLSSGAAGKSSVEILFDNVYYSSIRYTAQTGARRELTTTVLKAVHIRPGANYTLFSI